MDVESINKSNWERMLGTYAVAGGAVMLTASDASAAPIVFSNQNVEIGKDETFDLDLNLDNTIDFSFRNSFIDNTGVKNDQRVLDLLVAPNNAYISQGGGVAQLGAGTTVGPTPPNKTAYSGDSDRLATVGGGGPKGPNWTGVNAFLGLRFDINGQLHFGWAELSVSNSTDINCAGPTGTMACASTATLLSWAYNDVAGESIVTGAQADVPVPEPASLSLLAMGAAALGAVRARRKRQLQKQADRA